MEEAILPAMRFLRERVRVGLAQLRQVMETLEAEGVVARRARSGLYKVAPPGGMRAVYTLDLIACGRLVDVASQSEQSFTGDLIKELAAEAGRRDLAIRLRQVYADESVSRYEQMAADGSVGGCLLLAPHLPEIADIFERRGIKTVSIIPDQKQTAGVTISVDPGMVDLQCGYLWKLGHRRIAYMDFVDARSPRKMYWERREAFYRFMGGQGVPVRPEWVFRVPPGREEKRDVAEVLSEVFHGPGRPTAVIASDVFAPALYRFAATGGWRIGAELSVMGTDDIALAAHLDPPLTTVRNDRRRIAVWAIETLLKRLSGREIVHDCVTDLTLVERSSVGSAVEILTC